MLYTIYYIFLFFYFFYLTYSRWTSSLPSCLWSQRIFPSLPGSRLTTFLSRCKFSTFTTCQPMVKFYLLTFPRFPLRKKEHISYFGNNQTHDFGTSRCAGYLLDNSGGDYILYTINYILYTINYILHTIYYILYTTYYILYTIYYILYIIYYILYTVYYILYTIYCILYTVYILDTRY